MSMSKVVRSVGETPAESRYRKTFAGRRRGESLAALAARVGVASGTLSWWRHELRRRDRARAEGGAAPILLPVRVLDVAPPPVPEAEGATGYEVLLAGGRRVLRVPARFEPEAVRALVAAVEGATC